MGLGVGFGFIPHLAALNDDRLGIATARDRVTDGHRGSHRSLCPAKAPSAPAPAPIYPTISGLWSWWRSDYRGQINPTAADSSTKHDPNSTPRLWDHADTTPQQVPRCNEIDGCKAAALLPFSFFVVSPLFRSSLMRHHSALRTRSFIVTLPYPIRPALPTIARSIAYRISGMPPESTRHTPATKISRPSPDHNPSCDLMCPS